MAPVAAPAWRLSVTTVGAAEMRFVVPCGDGDITVLELTRRLMERCQSLMPDVPLLADRLVDERDGSMNPATPEENGELEKEEVEDTTSIFGEAFGGDLLTAPLEIICGESPQGKRKRIEEEDEEEDERIEDSEGEIFDRVTRRMAKSRNY